MDVTGNARLYALKELLDTWHNEEGGWNAEIDPTLQELGALRRALLAAVEAVDVELGPAIVAGFRSGMTYVELCAVSGYSSTTTITKIMRDQGASPGTGTRSKRLNPAA